MSAIQIEQYANDLIQTVIASAEAESLSTHDVFAEQVIGDLEAAGIVDDGFVAYYKAHGVEISGYGHSEGINSLDLFLVSFRGHPLLQKIGTTEVAMQAKRVVNYLEKVEKGLKKEIDDSSDAYDMALAVEHLLKSVTSVRVFLVTNDISTIRRHKGEVFGELPVTFEVWDLNRLHRMATSGVLHEPIVVDFDPPLPCLTTPKTDDDYSVFLSIVPGEVLGRVYSEYGSRLLELNVRSFLQLKGAVNRGIRETLLTSPERFLAYNNGISATASKVDLVRLPSGEQAIRRIHDLQIVNGGQTTASIHNAYTKKECDLENVLVQMKLTQVNPQLLEEIVPEISKYSNTQNKVTVVDFSSNHPFHVELEKVSRSLWAPAVDGSGQETKWFYERARGQYADALNKERTPAKQKQFKIIFPLKQKFAKTDVAKWDNSWSQLPHLVSRGAEKNFRAFMDEITRTKSSPPTADRGYVERLLAKGILFKEAERVVTEQRYGGYRANIVTYTIAKISHDTAMRLDLDRIWREQAVTDALADAIAEVSRIAHRVIISPPAGTTHVGEWTKKDACWVRVQAEPWTPSKALDRELIPLGKAALVRRAEQAASQSEGETRDVAAAMDVSSEIWFGISHWAKETQNLLPWQRALAFSLGKIAARRGEPSVKQAKRGLEILEEAQDLGFRA
jgi:hypothetical protein